jgi:hypothetical protein
MTKDKDKDIDNTEIKWHCGVDPVPKGKKRASMKHCAENGQIRYYGIKKVDPTLLESIKKKKMSGMDTKTYTKLRIKLVVLQDKKRKTIEKIKIEKDATKKEKMKIEAKKMIEEIKELSDKYFKLKKDLNISRESRTSTKSRKVKSKKAKSRISKKSKKVKSIKSTKLRK